ncbi:hypothetical protein F8M41_018972 [Gigaspora margarita]|uniref:Uncharacterized protein n=1 Tax=Gigaspora margarita TaxID=4874 RepID=A0A8H4AKS3_GIGMA|nr:hypothetical protein F8M41_018972 [Gigaspora margarita]
MSIPMKDDKVTSQENSDSEWIDVDNDLVNENTGIIQVGSKSEQDSTEQSTTTSSDNSQINLKNDSDEITPKFLNVWIQSSCGYNTRFGSFKHHLYLIFGDCKTYAYIYISPQYNQATVGAQYGDYTFKPRKYLAIDIFNKLKSKHAETCLFKALQTIALEKGVLAEKAKSFLDIFDEHIRTSNARQFWNSIQEDSNVLKEHINENDKILSKTKYELIKTNPQQKKKRSHSPTCSEEYSSFDSEIVPISLTNVFRKILEESEKNKDKAIESESVTHLSRAVELEYNNLDETTELGSNIINEETELELKNLDDATKFNDVNDKRQKTKQYIIRDLVKEVLEVYQTCVLPDEQLIYNGTNVLDFIYSTNELKKSPLSIGVINLHNVDCTKFLPVDFKKDIAKQLQDPKIKSIKFSNIIDKLHVNCDEVLKFLDKFDNVTDLKFLGERLDENVFRYSSASNDMIYVHNLLYHFYFLYKNDILLQPMSEHELNTHIWTPLLRNVFLEKTDIKLSYGELASRSYNKLKEMLNVPGNSLPKLDGKGLLRSLGTEILAQEDGVLNTYGKRTGDLKKLEYCTKIILTVLYFALPTTERNEITEIETYSLQSNGFQLIISASKYLFENTIIIVDLQDIEVPRTVEGFSKLVKGIKIILSWKARTRNNTNKFYEVLKKGNERIKNGELFTPKRIFVT